MSKIFFYLAIFLLPTYLIKLSIFSIPTNVLEVLIYLAFLFFFLEKSQIKLCKIYKNYNISTLLQPRIPSPLTIPSLPSSINFHNLFNSSTNPSCTKNNFPLKTLPEKDG